MKKHLGMKRSETVNRKRKTRIRRSVLQKQNMTHRGKKEDNKKKEERKLSNNKHKKIFPKLKDLGVQTE